MKRSVTVDSEPQLETQFVLPGMPSNQVENWCGPLYKPLASDKPSEQLLLGMYPC